MAIRLLAPSETISFDAIRIALQFKRVDYAVDLWQDLDAGVVETLPEHVQSYVTATEPSCLLFDGHRIMTESLAAVTYLDELFPDPPLFPWPSRDRAQTYTLGQIVTCGVESRCHRDVLDYLAHRVPAMDRLTWRRQWTARGLGEIETLMALNVAQGRFCVGDTVTYADALLTPLVWSAKQLGLSLDDYPTVKEVYWECMSIAAFASCAPGDIDLDV